MATRSTTSEFYPSPPINRLNTGRITNRVGNVYGTSSAGVKPNMCIAPATNGERAFGKVTASQTSSTTRQMKVVNSFG